MPRAILSPSSSPTSPHSAGALPTTRTSPTRDWRPRCSAPPGSPSRCSSKAKPGSARRRRRRRSPRRSTRALVRLQCYEGIDSTEALYEWNYARQLLGIRLAEARGEGARRCRSVHARVPRRTAAAERAAASRTAPGGPPRRRGRPRRRRVRGVPVRAPRRVVGHDPRARHATRRVSADRRVDLEPHPRPPRCVEASLPLSLDRLPRSRPRQRDHPDARACRHDRRSPIRSPPPSPVFARWTCRRHPGSPRRSGGLPRSEVLGFEVLDAEAAELTIGSVLKYRDDAELAAARSYDWVATG